MFRREFLTRLFGLLGVAALPVAAWAGPVEEGEAAWSRGDLAGAIAAWEAALTVEKDPARRVDLLLRLAGAHRERGALAAADARLKEAESTGLLAARVANDRGLFHLAAGDAVAAEASLRRAFDVARAANDPALAATAANNLGLARLALGRVPDATKAFDAASALFATLGDPRGQADARTNLGLAHRRAGRLRDARASLEAAVEQFRAANDTLGAVDATNDLGVVLQALGLDDAARPLYERALAEAPDSRRKAALTANLATLAHRHGDAPRARELYAAAEALLQAAGRPDEAVAVALQRLLLGTPDAAEYRTLYARARDPRVRATAALNLAGLVWQSAPEEAGKLAEEARTLLGAAAAWRADFVEGRVAMAAGRRPEALQKLQAAVDALEASRRTLSEEESAGFRGEYAAVYTALVEANLAAGDTSGVALAAEKMALADHDGALVPEDEPAKALQALSDRQAWLEGALRTAAPEAAGAIRTQLAAVQAEFAAQVDTLRATYPNFAELVRTDPEDLEAVRQELAPGVVVVQPVSLPSKLVLLVYRRERMVVREVPVGSETLTKAVYLVAKSLRAADTWDPEWTQARCDELGTWLYAPVADEFATATTVVVSATGVFRQLPFAILRHQGAWLAERAPVVSVTHVGSLRTAAKAFRVDGKSTLLVGNPDGTLPGAEAEVRTVGEALHGATRLVGSMATHDAVLAAAAGKSLVHLATHGLLDAEFPDKSLIVLAGHPDPAGRLAYREIPGLGAWLDKTRLVVLSACQSALPGDVVAAGKPPMAVNGLAGQFRRAGVETLVASLWSVSDEATRLLMSTFYARLSKGDNIGVALQSAQLALSRSPDYAHPFYWAPFIVVGDWR